MNFDNFTNVTSNQERDLEMSRAFPSLMRKVYIWMAMALAITGVVAYGAGHFQPSSNFFITATHH